MTVELELDFFLSFDFEKKANVSERLSDFKRNVVYFCFVFQKKKNSYFVLLNGQSVNQ